MTALVSALVTLAALAVAVFLVRQWRVHPHPTRRRSRPVILTLVALGGLAGGVVLARELWFGLRPTPEFAVLGDHPDPSLVGTVAYIASDSGRDCVDVVPASGTPSTRLRCFDSSVHVLAWLPDGRLEVTGYGSVDHPEDRWRLIIDLRAGTTEEVPQAQIPEEAPPVDSRGPDGEQVVSETEEGRLRVTLTTASGTRELLSVGAPNTYTFGDPAWSPDGQWFVVKDDLDQIVLITTTSDPSSARVLVEGGHGPAVTDTILSSAAN